MTQKKLFELLSLVEEIKSDRWGMVMAIVKNICDSETYIVKKEWADDFKTSHPEWYPLDLHKIETWTTFEGECIDIRFTSVDGNLHCLANIYDGDTLDGYRERLRFTAEIILPKDFIKNITKDILYSFEKYLKQSYQDYLETKEQTWINELKTKILSN